jgi:hypothetical protein
MGNPSRCPVCNRFGTVELNGFCKACAVDPNAKGLWNFIKINARTNPTVVKGALLEVGAARVADIKQEDVIRVANIIKRRLPVNRRGHLVSDTNPMENYGYAFKDEKESYGIEKEVCDYERLE